MKTLKVLVVAAVVLSSFPIFAQQADANVQQSATAGAGNTQVNQSAGANASASRRGAQANGYGAASGTTAANGMGAANGSAAGSASGAAEMRPVNGQLQGRLDSKTAKAGDRVVVKTTEKARTADGVVIPKGSRLIGHVTNVQAHGRGNADGQMAIEFDRAELRGGQSMAIHSVIQSVSPSSSATMMAGADNEDGFGGPMMGGMAGGGARGGMAGGARGGAGGGGLLGGAGAAAGSTVHAAGSVAGNAGYGLGAVSNGAAGAGGRAAGGVAGTGANVGGAATGGGFLAARPTGIPGLNLAGDASGASSGMLTANRKNVHLDSGTNMVLGVSSAGAR